MTAYKLEESLKTLDIPFDRRRVLLVLPLAYVAWAQGKVEPAQTSMIERVARETFHLSPQSQAMVIDWLQHRPTEAYFRQGLHALRDFAVSKTDIELTENDMHHALVLCAAVARLGADSVGAPETATGAQRRALYTLAAELDLEDTRAWASIADALERDASDDERAGTGGDRVSNEAQRDAPKSGASRLPRRHRTRVRLEDRDPLEPRGGIV